MNERGNLLLIVLAAMILLAILPVLLAHLFWPVKLVAQIIFVFVIYSTVRGFMGPGHLTIVISAVLIYFMVFKYFDIMLSLYIFQLMLGVQFLSVIIWGIGTRMR
ncbi:MAG: hypothetical protein J4224_00960 [Candidatus Diapherotrites archaeon]|uniref:Uncharacterized protein n=1 Tax=Candidatus Iainarchaeum sp. TaxID=3101447 RepID=A0A7J4IVY2_9ARCH|nr:MAG: hypothetical protein QT03_C0001G0749 [archaeon GW2011_AR10]MBS3058979.1 hypothetical protein [Candidatus Diapherotrites archaeon]HIH08934.1 hypothetical protein [Candidatus Diapherotrites archaeon]